MSTRKQHKFRPMLGHTDVPSDEWLKWYFDSDRYFYAFIKYDGIRLLHTPEGPLTRTLHRLPNVWTSNVIANHCPLFTDGEVVCAPGVQFHDVQSQLMTIAGQVHDFRYMVFDSYEYPDLPFCQRHAELEKRWNLVPTSYIQLAPYRVLSDFATLQLFEQQVLDEGHEGLILRSPLERYKYGRSTLNEAGMLKLKRTLDDEAEIIGFEQRYINQNSPEINALGLQERKHGIDGMVPAGILGAFICYHPKFGQFNVGTGFTQQFARSVWENQEQFIHERLTFTYQPYGMKDKPRCPRFKGIRYD